MAWVDFARICNLRSSGSLVWPVDTGSWLQKNTGRECEASWGTRAQQQLTQRRRAQSLDCQLKATYSPKEGPEEGPSQMLIDPDFPLIYECGPTSALCKADVRSLNLVSGCGGDEVPGM